MMRLLLLLPLMFLMFGCSHNHFNVPKNNFAQKVRVMGVVPIIVDADSDIRHPQKEQLIPMIAEINRKYESQLVRKLKQTGNFYTVALMDGDPQRIFSSLLFRREKRDDAAIQYNKYFWKSDELKDYIRKNNLDAVMMIVVGGLNKNEKIFSSNLIKQLTTDYNFMVMSAQILDSDNTVLWEYPNFRSRILSYHPMTNLQYPDFSEADANLSSKADVKFKTLEGIRRTLELRKKDILRRETMESDVYSAQFDEIISLLKYDPDLDKADDPPLPEKPKTGIEQPKPVDPQPVKPQEPPSAVQAPPTGSTAPTTPVAPETPAAATPSGTGL